MTPLAFSASFICSNSSFTFNLASALFAATFKLTGAWFDLARIDSLFVFLALSSVYFLRFTTFRGSSFLSALLISLSFLTKQSALFLFIPMAVYCLLTNWRRAIHFIGWTVLIVSGAAIILDSIHEKTQVLCYIFL